MADVVTTFGGAEEAQRRPQERAHVIEAAGACRAEDRFQFRKHLFDRIEVRAVRGQEAKRGAGLRNGGLDGGMLVDRQVVEHDDVARLQGRHQHLLDVREKTGVIDGAIEDRRRCEAVQAQGREDRVGLPVAAGRPVVEPGAPRAAAIAAEQIGRHPALVEKDVLPDIAERLPADPLSSRGDDVRASLLVGAYRFF